MSLPPPPPGWYPDPSGQPRMLYWDGRAWLPPAGAAVVRNSSPGGVGNWWRSQSARSKTAAIIGLVIAGFLGLLFVADGPARRSYQLGYQMSEGGVAIAMDFKRSGVKAALACKTALGFEYGVPGPGGLVYPELSFSGYSEEEAVRGCLDRLRASGVDVSW
jgi:hypothetical protein